MVKVFILFFLLESIMGNQFSQNNDAVQKDILSIQKNHYEELLRQQQRHYDELLIQKQKHYDELLQEKQKQHEFTLATQKELYNVLLDNSINNSIFESSQK